MAVKGKREWVYRGPEDPTGLRKMISQEMWDMRERLAHLSQAEMATRLAQVLQRAIYPANVSNWERGKRPPIADVYVAYREIAGAPRPLDVGAQDPRAQLMPRVRDLEAQVAAMQRILGRQVADRPVTPDDMISAPAAAELVDTSRQTIHNWVKAGDVRSVKVGNRLFVSRSDVLAHPREN